MQAASAKSEQLESALSEYLRPSDLEDAEARENEDPNMYHETSSHKSGVEEKKVVNVQETSLQNSPHKEKFENGKFLEIPDLFVPHKREL